MVNGLIAARRRGMLRANVAPGGQLEVIARLIAGLFPEAPGAERRRQERYPFPRLMTVEPIDDLGQSLGQRLTVVGRELSLAGMSFFHPDPLSFRRVLVEVEVPDGDAIRLFVDLKWCRFTPQGWYESGGQILGISSSADFSEAKAG